MISRISSNIADFIRANNDRAASKEVLMFSIGIFLNTFIVTAIILGVSLITGRFWYAAGLLVSYVLLRFFSGGMHLPSSTLCNIVSVGVFVIVTHLPINWDNVGLILNILALIFVAIYAPTKDVTTLSWFGPKYGLHFKILCIFIVLSNFLMKSPMLSVAFFVQALTLLPISYKFAALFERR